MTHYETKSHGNQRFFFFAAHEIKADLRYQDDDVYIIEFRDYFQVF